MKKIPVLVFSLLLALASLPAAQVKDDLKSAGKDTGRAVKDAGHDVKKTAKKGANKSAGAVEKGANKVKKKTEPKP